MDNTILTEHITRQILTAGDLYKRNGRGDISFHIALNELRGIHRTLSFLNRMGTWKDGITEAMARTKDQNTIHYIIRESQLIFPANSSYQEV